MASLTQIIDSYVDLLPMQYRDKPKARSVVALLVKQGLADFLAREMNRCYDLDLASGAQQDILAKYIGVSRKQDATLTEEFFGFWDYTVVDDEDQNPRGFSNYEDGGSGTPTAFGNTVAALTTETIPSGENQYWTGDLVVNGILVVDGNLTQGGISPSPWRFLSYQFSGQDINLLSDGDMALLMRLKIIINTTDNTLYSINNYLMAFFAGGITVVDNKDMTLTYYVSDTVTLDPAVLEPYLPKPMGVSTSVVYL